MNNDDRARAWAMFRIGLTALADNRPRDGVASLAESVSLHPCAKYHANLAVALERLAVDATTDPDQSRDLLEQSVVASLAAIRARPRFTPAIANLVLVLERLGRTREALYWSSLVTTLAPRSADAAWSRAGLLAIQWEWGEAAYWYAMVRQLKPSQTTAIHNEVSCLTSAGRVAEALYLLYQDLCRDPLEPLTWTNLGVVHRRLGRNSMAVDCFDRAIAIEPAAAPAKWGRSLALLALGRMEEGWREYEWGLATGERRPPRPFKVPRWEGQPIQGTLLVWMEQGLGDHIVWASMLDNLASRATLVVECEHRLVALFQRSFPWAVVAAQTDPPQPCVLMPEITHQIPTGSLPALLRPTLASYDRTGPYLLPDQSRVAEWRTRLDSLGPGPKIGISWRSLKYEGVGSQDSMRLSQWGPILSIPGIHWINLQPGWTKEEMAEGGDRFDARIHTWSDLDLVNDIDEQAALISCLDLVVSAFTATAQLTGALDIACWVLAHRGNQSWWSLGTDYCPWHPSIGFYHCRADGPWEEPITSLAVDLERAHTPRK